MKKSFLFLKDEDAFLCFVVFFIRKIEFQQLQAG